MSEATAIEKTFEEIKQDNFKKQATATEEARETVLKFLEAVQRPLIAADIQHAAQGNLELAGALNTISPGSHTEIRACGLALRNLKDCLAAGLQLRAKPAGGNLMCWFVVPAVADSDDLANIQTPESLQAIIVNLGYMPTALELLTGSIKYPSFYLELLPKVVRHLQHNEFSDATIRALVHRAYFESRTGQAMQLPEDPVTFTVDGLEPLTWNKAWGDCLADLPLSGTPAVFGENIRKRLELVAETAQMIRFKRKALMDKADSVASLIELERQAEERAAAQAKEDAKPKATIASKRVQKNFKNAPAAEGTVI